MGKLGRKPLPPVDRRSTTVGVRFTFAERVRLCHKAQTAGCTMTQLIRAAALDLRLKPSVIVPEINRTAWLELARLGSSLDSALWRLEPDEQLAEKLRAISRRLNEVRALLRGTPPADIDDARHSDGVSSTAERAVPLLSIEGSGTDAP